MLTWRHYYSFWTAHIFAKPEVSGIDCDDIGCHGNGFENKRTIFAGNRFEQTTDSGASYPRELHIDARLPFSVHCHASGD